MLVLIVLGTTLRFWSLDRAVVWADEGMTLIWVSGLSYPAQYRLAKNEVITFQELNRRTQRPSADRTIQDVLASLKDCALYRPILYVLLFYWGKLFGFDIGHMRILPAIIGMFAALAAYWFGIELFRSRWPALLATAFILVSPLAVHFSREIREASLIILLSLLASASFLLAFRTGRTRHWCLYSLIMICGFYSSFSVWPVYAANLVYAVVTEKPWRNRLSKRLIGVLTASLIGFLISLPNLIDLALHYKAAIQWVAWTDAPQQFSHLFVCWLRNFAWPFLYSADTLFVFPSAIRPDRSAAIWNVVNPILMVTYCIFTLVTVVSAMTAFRCDRERTFRYLALLSLVPFLYLGLPDLFGAGYKSLVARYNLISSLAVVYFVAFACWFYCKRSAVWQRSTGLATIAFVLGCSLCASLYDVGERERSIVGPSQLAMYKFLKKHPDALIVTIVRLEAHMPCLRGLSHLMKGENRLLILTSPGKLERFLPPGTSEFYFLCPQKDLLRHATDDLHFTARNVNRYLVRMTR